MPRENCDRCQRAKAVCICTHLPDHLLKPPVPVLVLQHPSEQDVFLNTLRIADLCLTDLTIVRKKEIELEKIRSLLYEIGVTKPFLFYPPSGSVSDNALTSSVDVALLEQEHSQNQKKLGVELKSRFDGILLLDGTWRNTREIKARNSWLNELPHLFTSKPPESRYILRSAAVKNSMSTLESLAYLFRLLDPQFPSEHLLQPLDAMIALQKKHMGSDIFSKHYGSNDSLRNGS